MASKHLFGNYGKHLPNICYIGKAERIPCDNINQRVQCKWYSKWVQIQIKTFLFGKGQAVKPCIYAMRGKVICMYTFVWLVDTSRYVNNVYNKCTFCGYFN